MTRFKTWRGLKLIVAFLYIFYDSTKSINHIPDEPAYELM